MIDLFAELAGRRVAAGRLTLDCPDERRRRWDCPPRERGRPRPRLATVPHPERAPPSGPAWPGAAPEALLGLWTELAWRHCHAVSGREGTHDPDEHPAHAA